MIHIVRIAIGFGWLLVVALVVGLFDWLEYKFPCVMDTIGNVFVALMVIALFSVLAYYIGGVFL